MNYQNMIFGTVGGLGIFIFGMKIMSEGLQKSAGARMRHLLQMLTGNRVIAMLVGLSVTAVIQSSSACTVMVVSFVNAGLMTLTQAIGVVLGANIGTTVTAQVIAFKVQAYALPAIGVGVGFKLFAKADRWKNIGEILIGFGLLFYGLTVMKDAFGPLKSSEMVRELFVQFANNPLLAVLAATIFTMIVQSSSATVAITMALASTGLLDFRACVALILGDNIGTTITAELASIGGTVTAKRTARAHTLFNVIGVAWILLILPAYVRFVDAVTPGDSDFVVQTTQQAARYSMAIGEKPYIARHIANAHTIFNVVNNLLFLPLVNVLARLATLLTPDKGKEVPVEFHLKYLDAKVLETPDIALGQARLEVARMAEVADAMLRRWGDYFGNGDESHYTRIVQEEQLVDLLQKEITDFLTNLSQKSISAEGSKEVADMLHISADLERVADHAENLAKLTYRMQNNRVEFSEEARREMEDIYAATQEFLTLVTGRMMEENGQILPLARTHEAKVNQLEDNLRAQHIRRLQEGTCQVESALIYIDMLTNLEKIGDHSFNIAEFLAGAR